MNVGDNVSVTIIGKITKEQLYVDGKIRVTVEDANNNEMAIVLKESVVEKKEEIGGK